MVVIFIDLREVKFIIISIISLLFWWKTENKWRIVSNEFDIQLIYKMSVNTMNKPSLKRMMWY